MKTTQQVLAAFEIAALNHQQAMKTPKHTPGPWKAEYNCTTLITGIVDGQEVEVAHVDDSDDACLIAAAPELLEALRELLASVTSQGAEDSRLPIVWSGSPSQNRRMNAAIKGARAALSKSRQNAE